VKFRSTTSTLFGLVQGHGSWSCVVGAHAWRLENPTEHLWGTCVFVRRIPVWNQKSHLAPKSEDPDREVAQPLRGIGGLHQVVSEHQFFICRLQVKEEKKETENLELYSVCDR
jgi:hypothetical protein